MTASSVTLHICVTCRAGEEPVPGQDRPGRRLYDAMAMLGSESPFAVTSVECLAACDRGCMAAVSAPGKFSYLLGGLDETLCGDLASYVTQYAASPSGVVLPSRRPASLRQKVIGRLPDPRTG